MTKKHIEVTPYNPEWSHQYEQESRKIRDVLGHHCVDVHHIGSTSVPGLPAKNMLDILCIVDELPESRALESIGYVHKGEFNIPLRSYFTKKTDQAQVNLHVVEPNHGFIALNLCFRDYLRKHKEAREEYAHLKEKLLQDPTSYERQQGSFSGYNLGKDIFIKSILKKAHFEGLTVNFCLHHREWSEYHRIRKTQIADLKGIPYDPTHPRFEAPNHYHFVLYKGTEIIGISHVEFRSDSTCILRPFAIDAPFQNQGYGSQFLRIIENWLQYQGIKALYLHAHQEAVSFYERLGYIPMTFEDQKTPPPITIPCVDLGKRFMAEF